MFIKLSLDVFSTISNRTSTVATGDSDCPLTTLNWNSGVVPSFILRFDPSFSRNLRNLASGTGLEKKFVSVRLSMFNSPMSMGKYSILGLPIKGRFVHKKKNFVSPSGVTWSCEETWSSQTGSCFWLLCFFGGKLHDSVLPGDSEFTVQKSHTAYGSASDTSESVIRSLLLVWSLGVLFLFLCSNLSLCKSVFARKVHSPFEDQRSLCREQHIVIVSLQINFFRLLLSEDWSSVQSLMRVGQYCWCIRYGALSYSIFNA